MIVALVDVHVAQDLFDERALVRVIVDHEIGSDADRGAVAAQHAHADRMERADPQTARRVADERLQARAQFARCLVREGDGEDAVRRRAVGREEVRDAMRQDARLTRARAGEDEDSAIGVSRGGALLVVELVERIHQRAAVTRSPRPSTEPAGTAAFGSTATSSPRIAPRTVPCSPTLQPGHKIASPMVAPSPIAPPS